MSRHCGDCKDDGFAPFELAVKLKEKGYPQCVYGKYHMLDACYVEEGEFFEKGCITEAERAYTAPTISQVLKWLREEKKLHIEVMFIRPLHNRVKYYITDTDGSRGDFMDVSDEHYETWEQATLAGIEYVLDNLI